MKMLLLLLCLAPPAFAVIESHEFASDDLLARYQALSAELRCPKCQNQNIADSDAPIAADLRGQLHRQLHEGKSDAEIVDYMVQRYGEFVLYRPRLNPVTLVLWLAPLIFLALGLGIVWALLRRGEPLDEAADSAEDVARHTPEPRASSAEGASSPGFVKDGANRD